MKTLLLTTSSSNEKSLKNFIELLKENFKNKQTSIIKIGRFIENKKIVTILKSPHVNKSAQEQFEKREKIVQIFIISENFNKIIITVKKILNTIFRDIKLTVKYLTNSHSRKSNLLGVFKNTNFKINYTNKIRTNKLLFTKKTIKDLYAIKSPLKLKTYLTILSNYGDIIINNE
jgi:ribosomal protein S10